MMSVYVPVVLEHTSDGERSYDLYSRLLKDRIVFINGEIEPTLASTVVAQLLFLDSQSNEDITLYINSPGGSVRDGLMITDTMHYIKSDVSTVVIGLAASMGSFISSSGTKGKRYCLKNTEYLIHQVIGGIRQAQASDVKIQAENIIKTKELLNKMLAENTGQSYEKVVKDTDRDNYMTAQEALEYGLVDEIIEKRI